MTKQVAWKKAQAVAALTDIAGDISDFFGVPAPVSYQPEYRTGQDWQIRIDRLEVWTKAGRAELAVDVSRRFAHLYFRFDDPARAEKVFDMSRHDQRLNRHSGKWNRIGTPDSWARDGKPCPETSLDMFRAELRRDFRRVAEPNPCPDDVAAYRAKEAARAAQFAAYLNETRAGV